MAGTGRGCVGSINSSGSKKSVFHVKVTESIYKDLLSNANRNWNFGSSGAHICFNRQNNGTISFPGDSLSPPPNHRHQQQHLAPAPARTYTFSAQSQRDRHSEHLPVKREYLGSGASIFTSFCNIDVSLRVHANAESFTNVKDKINTVKAQNEQNCTKVYRQNGSSNRRPGAAGGAGAGYYGNAPYNSANGGPGPGGGPDAADDGRHDPVLGGGGQQMMPLPTAKLCEMPLRDRVVHKLAVANWDKIRLIQVLRKEGVANNDGCKIGLVLQTVGNSLGKHVFSLKRSSWQYVRDDWPYFTPDERQQMRANRRKAQQLEEDESSRSPADEESGYASRGLKRNLADFIDPTAKRSKAGGATRAIYTGSAPTNCNGGIGYPSHLSSSSNGSSSRLASSNISRTPAPVSSTPLPSHTNLGYNSPSRLTASHSPNLTASSSSNSHYNSSHRNSASNSTCPSSSNNNGSNSTNVNGNNSSSNSRYIPEQQSSGANRGQGSRVPPGGSVVLPSQLAAQSYLKTSPGCRSASVSPMAASPAQSVAGGTSGYRSNSVSPVNQLSPNMTKSSSNAGAAAAAGGGGGSRGSPPINGVVSPHVPGRDGRPYQLTNGHANSHKINGNSMNNNGNNNNINNNNISSRSDAPNGYSKSRNYKKQKQVSPPLTDGHLTVPVMNGHGHSTTINSTAKETVMNGRYQQSRSGVPRNEDTRPPPSMPLVAEPEENAREQSSRLSVPNRTNGIANGGDKSHRQRANNRHSPLPAGRRSTPKANGLDDDHHYHPPGSQQHRQQQQQQQHFTGTTQSSASMPTVRIGEDGVKVEEREDYGNAPLSHSSYHGGPASAADAVRVTPPPPLVTASPLADEVDEAADDDVDNEEEDVELIGPAPQEEINRLIAEQTTSYDGIKSVEERRMYRRKFENLYCEYLELHSELARVKSKFNDFCGRMEQHEEGSAEYLLVRKEMAALYRADSPSFFKSRDRFRVLSGVLDHIKRAVYAYDEYTRNNMQEWRQQEEENRAEGQQHPAGNGDCDNKEEAHQRSGSSASSSSSPESLSGATRPQRSRTRVLQEPSGEFSENSQLKHSSENKAAWSRQVNGERKKERQDCLKEDQQQQQPHPRRHRHHHRTNNTLHGDVEVDANR